MKKTCSRRKLTSFFNPPGFTLIEMMIVISIIVILVGFGWAQFNKFNRKQIVDQAVLELKTNLTHAREMALSGKKTCTGTLDGVLVEFDTLSQSYSLYSSCDYPDPAPDKRVLISTYELRPGVLLGTNPGSILFNTVTGGTNLATEQEITLANSAGNSGGVKVTPSGKIEIVVATPTAGPCAGTVESCGQTSCENCDDSNDCTLDLCDNNESCRRIFESNGTSCGDGIGTCYNGECCHGCVVPLGNCEAGTSNSNCGTNGDMCVDCTTSGQICVAGSCVFP